jgi:hypothetical protein
MTTAVWSNIEITAGIFVSLRTMSFVSAPHVFGMRNWFQMGGIAARPIFAYVIKFHAVRHNAAHQ